MEAHLYALLKERLPGAAIVSIAHRPEVVGFHDRHLNIDPERHALVEGAAGAEARAGLTCGTMKSPGMAWMASLRVNGRILPLDGGASCAFALS